MRQQPKGILTWCFPWLSPLLIGLTVGYHLAFINHNPQSQEVKNVSTVLER